jgi:hypothetical protein
VGQELDAAALVRPTALIHTLAEVGGYEGLDDRGSAVRTALDKKGCAVGALVQLAVAWFQEVGR